MLNESKLIGHVGQKPELQNSNGTSFTRMSVATTEKWRDNNSGQMQEKTEWHRVVLFGRAAENACTYLDKGSLIYVSGKLQTTEWEKDGVKRYTTEIVGQNVKYLDRMNGAQQGQGSQPAPQQRNQQSSAQRPQRQQPAAQQSAQPRQGFDGFDDDIPF